MKTILHLLTSTVRKTNTFGYWVNLAIYQIDRARFHQFLMQTTIAFFSFLRYCDLSSYFFFQSHILPLSFKLTLLSFIVIVILFLSSFPYSSVLFFSSSFRYVHLRRSRDTFPTFLLLSDSTAGSILSGKFFSVVFCAKQERDRGTNKTAARDQVTLVCLERFYRSCRPREIVFFCYSAFSL